LIQRTKNPTDVSGNNTESVNAVKMAADLMSTGSAEVYPPAAWTQWPAAWIGPQGQVHTAPVSLLEALMPVLVTGSDLAPELDPRANRRLWTMINRDDASAPQWKVLDPVFWPFIGIVGWSSQTPDMLQLAAWKVESLPWQIDDSWRQLLAATAAVKASRRKHVA